MEFNVMEVEGSNCDDFSDVSGVWVDDIDENNVTQMKFDSLEEAEFFYNIYAKCVRFSIRRQDITREKEDGAVIMREWVCHREGFRKEKGVQEEDKKRESRPLTRVGCATSFRVKIDKTIGKFVMTKFRKQHNHPMADECSVPFLRSHRSVKTGDIAQARAFHEVGFRTSNVMKFFAHQAGGYDKVGFTMKDMYNHLDSERREETKDGDVEGALGYLAAKKEDDPLFFYKYEVDEENRLSRLLWADSRARMDYQCFGDVLIFDATYNVNAYKKTLVMLAGINNHYMTIVFACALLSDETTDTYIWVLQTLIECMEQKMPISVLTDGGSATRKAIETVIPDARHRLCSWHLQRNVNLNVNHEEFRNGFSRCMTGVMSVPDFERAWHDLVNKTQPPNRKYVDELYSNRHKWGEAYFRGHFFANVRSNQRCEGIHAFVKHHVDNKLRLFEFVKSFDLGLAWLRNKECEAHTETKESRPVLITHLKELEAHCGELLTRNVFYHVRDEISKEPDLVVQLREEGEGEGEGSSIYNVSSYSNEDNIWQVEYDVQNAVLKCSCLLLESVGWPCGHTFAVMKSLRMKKLPNACICMRWTTNAITSMSSIEQNPIQSSVTQQARYRILTSTCKKMCYLASLTDQSFNEIRHMISEVTACLESTRGNDVEDDGIDGDGEGAPRQVFNIKDPVICRTKGSAREGTSSKSKTRRCTKCRSVGHNKTTCPKRSRQEGEMNESNNRMRQARRRVGVDEVETSTDKDPDNTDGFPVSLSDSESEEF